MVIRVDYKQGEPKGGTFKPKRFEVLCDDQTRPRESFTIPIRIRFTSGKHFTGQLYRAEPRSWAQSYTRVEGRLASDGRRARGYMLRIEDPSDPPGIENAPECGTFGRSHWHAKRVGSRRQPIST